MFFVSLSEMSEPSVKIYESYSVHARDGSMESVVSRVWVSMGSIIWCRGSGGSKRRGEEANAS